MNKLMIDQLIINSTFFMNWDHLEKIKFITANCSDSYGGEILTYSFDFESYTVYFNYNTSNEIIESEQVEFFHSIGESQDFNFILFSNFLTVFQFEIESVYSDEDEDVIFLKNGVNVYFNEIDNERVIQKIITRSDMSREFVRKTLVQKTKLYS